MSEPWHAVDTAEVARRLAVDVGGLDGAEAARRLDRYGPNELEAEQATPGWLVFARQFTSPLIFILVVAALVTAVLEEWLDTIVIGLVLVVNAIIGFTQERKAEESVRALQSLASPRARVIRYGHEQLLPSRELVPGDLVVLESGVRVPADLRLIEVNGLQIDESLLTGESLPVTKHTGPLPERIALAERTNLAFAGSMVTSGRGRGLVAATGSASQLGAIAERMRTEVSPDSPLQQRMRRLARLIGVIVAVVSVATFFLGRALGEPATEMFRFTVALAVSAIPEGLPIVLTITLAVGVRRMARRNAVLRRLAAVETLGSTTVIGSDKTGTLTENRMTVTAIHSAGRTWTLPDGGEVSAAAGDPGHPLHLTLLAGVLANEANVEFEDGELRTDGDPTEAALLVAAWEAGLDPGAMRAGHDRLELVPFESDRRYAATLFGHEGGRTLSIKGAPELVLALCNRQAGVDGPGPLDHDGVARAERAMASSGLRVLAMAERRMTGAGDGRELHEVVEDGELVFLGLQGMLDPPRAGVAEAVAGCRRSGIRPLMITGDHALTARAIAERVGIAEPGDRVLVGLEIDELGDAELQRAVREVSVFARVSPDHKLRIVSAAQAQGEVVAVTGDGVNDAPAIRAADIGIAMGRGGTDVAREAADMVLADDNFSSIYAAVHEGRVTFDNVRKVTFFLLSTGAAEILALVAALVLGWPLLMLPTQVLWLNLVTNGVQDMAMAFEPAEKDVLERPPRPTREGVVSRLLWQRLLLVGVVMAAGTLLLFDTTLESTGQVETARTVALTTMVLYQAFHLGNSRSERISVFRLNPFSNRFLIIAASTALGIHAVALYLPPTQFLLSVEPLSARQWLVSLAVASSVLAVVELHKLFVAMVEARGSNSAS